MHASLKGFSPDPWPKEGRMHDRPDHEMTLRSGFLSSLASHGQRQCFMNFQA